MLYVFSKLHLSQCLWKNIRSRKIYVLVTTPMYMAPSVIWYFWTVTNAADDKIIQLHVENANEDFCQSAMVSILTSRPDWPGVWLPAFLIRQILILLRGMRTVLLENDDLLRQGSQTSWLGPDPIRLIFSVEHSTLESKLSNSLLWFTRSHRANPNTQFLPYIDDT